MRSAWQAASLVLALAAAGRPASAQEARAEPRVSAELAVGGGSLDLSTDAASDGAKGVVAMHLRGAYALRPGWRLGLETGGWTLQPADFNRPERGEFVSYFGPFVQWSPAAARRLFLEGGYGVSSYRDNAPGGVTTRGTGWRGGAGVELPVRGRWYATLAARGAGGRFRDVRDPLVTLTGWRYDAWDAHLAFGVRFGRVVH